MSYANLQPSDSKPSHDDVVLPRADCEPVFVVGMNGSGTTMLLDCLGRHSNLYAFPKETRLIPHLIARQSTYGDLNVESNFRRLWEEIANLAVFREVNGGAPVPLPEDWESHPRCLAAILDAVFLHFAAHQGKRRWCEKTPHHVQHLLTLAEHFPGAKFIHVVRDGRDCAVSFHRRWKRQPELTIFRWKKVVALGRTHGAQLGGRRYLEIRYEDLTAQAEASLRRVSEFLCVPFDVATLESAQPYLQSYVQPNGFADVAAARGGLQRNSGKWQVYFSPHKKETLERIAGRVLASAGYETRYPASDADISGLQRRYWATMEALRQYFREIGLKLRGEVQRPWWVILSKPLNAFRQRQHNEY